MGYLNYSHLFYFQVIAKEGSIKKACKILHLTQPTLSDQLKSLERYLGVKLFDRRNRRLILNDIGKIALSYANRIFSLGNEFQRTISQIKTEENRLPIEIGIVPYLSKVFTYDLFLPIFELNVFRVKLKEAELKHLIQELDIGNIDLVVSNSMLPSNQKGLKSIKIGDSRFFAVGGSHLAFAANNFPKSLDGLAFFHYTDESPHREIIDIFFEKNKLKPKIVGEADDINFLKIVTGNNLCFSILPETSFKEYRKLKHLTLLGEIKELKSPIWATYNEINDSIYVKEFIKSLMIHSKFSDDEK